VEEPGQVVVFDAKFVYWIRSGPERALREITACKASSAIPHTIGETDTPWRQQYMPPRDYVISQIDFLYKRLTAARIPTYGISLKHDCLPAYPFASVSPRPTSSSIKNT